MLFQHKAKSTHNGRGRARIATYFLKTFFVSTLVIAPGYRTTYAASIVSGNIFMSGPAFGNAAPRPIFFFYLASGFRAFDSLTITWGSGSTKDGINIKPIGLDLYRIADVNKTGTGTAAVLQPDIRNDVYDGSYTATNGRIAFTRSWDTGDKSTDIPLKKDQPNEFQWELTQHSGTVYKGSSAMSFTELQASPQSL